MFDGYKFWGEIWGLGFCFSGLNLGDYCPSLSLVSNSRLRVISTDPNDFKVIKEGEAEIIMHAKNEVFYNKTQVINRDLSIVVLREFLKRRKQEHEAMVGKKRVRGGQKKVGVKDDGVEASTSCMEVDGEKVNGIMHWNRKHYCLCFSSHHCCLTLFVVDVVFLVIVVACTLLVITVACTTHHNQGFHG